MDREQATAFLLAHARPVYSYCLRRCGRFEDAQDVAQEILLRLFSALTRQEISDPLRYLWTTAHNTLARHYQQRSRCTIGVPPQTASGGDPAADLLNREEVRLLHRCIARLSRQQREITVLHYFHGMPVREVARRMQMPEGTVKWHLSQARKELHKKMTIPETSRLTFDPIRFSSFYCSGSIGTEGSPWRVLRSALHQNIVYACWRKALSLTEISDALGVAPVFIEDSIAYLTHHGYLTCEQNRYRCAILLTGWTPELIHLWDKAHQEAATLIAPALLSALDAAVLADENIRIPAGHGDAYACWALLPWMIASAKQDAIAFEDAATIRPDGAVNLCQATVTPPGVPQPALAEAMEQISGPCWNSRDGVTLWRLDSPWSPARITESIAAADAHALPLLHRHLLQGAPLSEEDYALLIQRGLFRRDLPGDARPVLQALWLRGSSIRDHLLEKANAVYQAHHEALAGCIAPLTASLMAQTPRALQRQRQYSLQELFHSLRFILHCLHHLVETGLLPLPAAEERAALHTIVLTD